MGTWRTRHNRRLSGNERERRGMSARDGAARRRAPSAGRRPARPVGAADAEPQDEEVTMLLEQAHRALHEGRVAEAEYLMRQILHYGHVSAVYNNLALLQLEYYHRPDEALRLLNKNLESPQVPWQPFTRAVAARCLLRMDRVKEARASLAQAVRDFEAGLDSPINREPWARRAWREYVSRILEAAGELGEDRMAWDLYRRWKEQIVLPSGHVFGGIAAFNLGRFRAASAAWRRARDRQRPYLSAYEAVARWCDRRLVEPFTLDYSLGGPDPPHVLFPFLMGIQPPRFGTIYLDDEGRPAAVGFGPPDDDAERRPEEGPASGRRWEDHPEPDQESGSPQESEEQRAAARAAFLTRFAAAMQRPANRMLLVWLALGPFLERRLTREDRPEYVAGVRELVAAGGDWGAATAQRLLLSPEIDLDIKEAVVQGLVDAGRSHADATVRIWFNGRVQDVPFKAGELRVSEDV